MKPINNEKQYYNALSRASDLMQIDLPSNSSESDELEVLSILIKEYETSCFALSLPHPLEAIRFRLEQLNISEQELDQLLDYPFSRSGILSGSKKLGLPLIRKINRCLGIPAHVLIQKY